jgi:rubrerythrin
MKTPRLDSAPKSNYSFDAPAKRIAAAQRKTRADPGVPGAVAQSEQAMSLKNFSDLTQREVLAIAIASEEEDNRIYTSFAEELAGRYPATAKVFEEMAAEEDGHRRRLMEIYQARFGHKLPAIRREDVKGFYSRRPNWLIQNLPLEMIRRQAEAMETDSQRFYVQAAEASRDVGVRKLLDDLAAVEKTHGERANALSEAILTESAREEEGRTAHKFFVLQYVQPGLAGLMDGSVSTLAPLFAAAFATQNNWSTFLVGLAASLGAGISMAFAEALSDDGSVTGRGAPIIRGAVCGVMTTAGGLGHSLPYLVPNSWPHSFWTATAIAGLVVFVELWTIAYIRARYMDTPFLKAVSQIVVGGAIVLAVGIFIGAS